MPIDEIITMHAAAESVITCGSLSAYYYGPHVIHLLLEFAFNHAGGQVFYDLGLLLYLFTIQIPGEGGIIPR